MTPELETTVTAERPCPACKAPLSAMSGRGVPAPGDLSLCAYCFAWLVVEASGEDVRLMSDREWLALDGAERARLTRIRDRFREARESGRFGLRGERQP